MRFSSSKPCHVILNNLSTEVALLFPELSDILCTMISKNHRNKENTTQPIYLNCYKSDKLVAQLKRTSLRGIEAWCLYRINSDNEINGNVQREKQRFWKNRNQPKKQGSIANTNSVKEVIYIRVLLFAFFIFTLTALRRLFRFYKQSLNTPIHVLLGYYLWAYLDIYYNIEDDGFTINNTSSKGSIP
jgi:hypothetical protein